MTAATTGGEFRPGDDWMTEEETYFGYRKLTGRDITLEDRSVLVDTVGSFEGRIGVGGDLPITGFWVVADGAWSIKGLNSLEGVSTLVAADPDLERDPEHPGVRTVVDTVSGPGDDVLSVEGIGCELDSLVLEYEGEGRFLALGAGFVHFPVVFEVDGPGTYTSDVSPCALFSLEIHADGAWTLTRVDSPPS